MKISQINFFQNKNIFLKNKKQNYVSFKSSPDSVEFSSKETNKPNKRFLDLVADEEMQQKIVNNLFIKSDGVYDREMENRFISFANEFINKYGERNGYNDKLNIIKGIYMSFKFLEENYKDKYIDDDLTALSCVCYTAFSYGMNSDEVVKFIYQAVTEDNKINISYLVTSLAEMEKQSLEQADEKTNTVGYSDICNYLNELMRASRIDNQQRWERVYGIVLNKDEDIDKDKHAFVCEIMKKLFSTLDRELKASDKDVYEQYVDIIDSIVNKFVKMSEDSDGNFDIQEARRNFNDWFSYSKKFPELLNKRLQFKLPVLKDGIVQEIQAPIENFNDIIPNIPNAYDNSIYRMLFLLGGSNAFSSDIVN